MDHSIKRLYKDNTIVMSPTDSLYFAYGSNMNPQRLFQRIGVVPDPIATVNLPGYLLKYSAGYPLGSTSYANLHNVGNKNYKAKGVVFALSAYQMNILDRYEGVDRFEHNGQGYHRKTVVVEIEKPISKKLYWPRTGEVPIVKGRPLRVVTYLAPVTYQLQGGVEKPAESYMYHLLYGASYYGLHRRYVQNHILRIKS